MAESFRSNSWHAYDPLKNQNWTTLQIDEKPRCLGLRTERHVRAINYENKNDMICKTQLVNVNGKIHLVSDCLIVTKEHDSSEKLRNSW